MQRIFPLTYTCVVLYVHVCICITFMKCMMNLDAEELQERLPSVDGGSVRCEYTGKVELVVFVAIPVLVDTFLPHHVRSDDVSVIYF